MKSFPCLLAALAMLSDVRAEPPPFAELHRASVTIPYSEVRALWEAAQARKAEAAKPGDIAPVAHLLHRAELELALGERASALSAVFDLETLRPEWQTIPLIGGEARLDKAEPKAAPIVWQDGYCLLTHQPGRSQATLSFTTRGLKTLTPENPLRLHLASATVKRLRVSGIPPGLEVCVDGSVAIEVKDGAAIFPLPGGEGEVVVQVAAPRIEPPPRPPAPSLWKTQSQTLVRSVEGRLHFQCRVFAHSDAGSGLEILLLLPPNAASISATGEDVAGSSSLLLDDGRRMVRVRWKTADVLDRELTISYATPQSPLAEQWMLQAPNAPEDRDARHLFAIVPAEGLELKGEGLRTAVTAHRLPEWMRKEIGGAAFMTAESGPQLALATHWLPAIATAEAIIAESKCQLRLVGDGSLQTTASYAIRHQAPLAWRLELPADVEILSCSVGGKPARAIQREKGAIEFNLPSSPSGAVTAVVIVYASKTRPLDPVSGQVALELPRTPLFIEQLDWAVSIPAVFEITAAEGNVAVSDAVKDAPSANSIVLRKDLCRAERPVVELFYQRRSLP